MILKCQTLKRHQPQTIKKKITIKIKIEESTQRTFWLTFNKSDDDVKIILTFFEKRMMRWREKIFLCFFHLPLAYSSSSSSIAICINICARVTVEGLEAFKFNSINPLLCHVNHKIINLCECLVNKSWQNIATDLSFGGRTRTRVPRTEVGSKLVIYIPFHRVREVRQTPLKFTKKKKIMCYVFTLFFVCH